MSSFESLELATAPKGNFPIHGKFNWDCDVKMGFKEKTTRKEGGKCSYSEEFESNCRMTLQ